MSTIRNEDFNRRIHQRASCILKNSESICNGQVGVVWIAGTVFAGFRGWRRGRLHCVANILLLFKTV